MRFRSLCALVASLLTTTAVTAAQPSRYVLVDFEDIGTWRASGGTGTAPGAWFAGSLFMGGSTLEKRYDQAVGEIRYAFEETDQPKQIYFTRARTAEVSAFIDAIEFDANPKGFNCAIAFDLLDAAGERFRTRKVELSGNEWRSYRLDINAETVDKFAEIRPPLRVERIHFSTSERQARSGSVFLDNITIVGTVTRERKVSISPIYEDIAWNPQEPVKVRYRLRNAEADARMVTVRLAAEDTDGQVVARAQTQVEVEGYGQQQVELDLGRLPVGPYAVKVELKSGTTQVSMLDWVGVFVPNGRRINRQGMMFGVQDLITWQAEGENALHQDWMGRIGLDLIRVGMTGGRFEPREGVLGVEPMAKMVNDLAAIDMDALVMYFTVPGWTQTEFKDRYMPDHWDAWEQHIRRIGAELNKLPNVKYIEFWNEPDISFYHGNLEDYIKGMRIFHHAMKAVAPRIRIVSGSSTGLDHPRHKQGFEAYFWEADNAYDVANFHAHGAFAKYLRGYRWMEEFIAKASEQKPIGNTESGERSGYGIDGAWNQADTLVKKITFSRHSDMEFYIWFTLQDYWDMDPNSDDSFGLITVDNRPKPSLLAYNELIRQLANTTPIEPLDLHTDLTTYSFRSADGREDVHVCWPTRQGNPVVLALQTSAPLRVIDTFGRTETVEPQGGLAFVVIQNLPIYLRTPAEGLQLADLSFVTYPPQVAAVPGGIADILLTLTNTWDQPVRFEVQLKGSDAASSAHVVELSPGQTAQMKLQATAAADRFGTRDLGVALRATGGIDLSFTLPVALHASYGVTAIEGTIPLNASQAIPQDLPAIELKRIEDVHELTHDPQIRQWSGADDLSVRAAAVYNEKGILFMFDVIDDKHVQEHSGALIWRGDSVQLAIQRPGDNEVVELAITLTSDGVQAWCHQAAEQALVGAWTHPATAHRQGDRTNYRLFVPFEVLGLEHPVGNTPFRFAFIVNEDDGQGRVRWLHWFEGIGKSKNPSEYGFGLIR